jgi:hypothetical protein
MAKRVIDYGRAVEQALRTVVRDVLARVQREGLLGGHHFFITFRTQAPGVEMAAWLRERFPEEITIVLQHQFWGLEVDERQFAVTLSFNNVAERLVVPYPAVKVFYDPYAEFVLQFTLEPEGAAGSRVVSLTKGEDRRQLPTLVQPATPVGEPGTGEPAPPAGEEKRGAEIVTLDRFRKK